VVKIERGEKSTDWSFGEEREREDVWMGVNGAS
jgi:hypothetical protein